MRFTWNTTVNRSSDVSSSGKYASVANASVPVDACSTTDESTALGDDGAPLNHAGKAAGPVVVAVPSAGPAYAGRPSPPRVWATIPLSTIAFGGGADPKSASRAGYRAVLEPKPSTLPYSGTEAAPVTGSHIVKSAMRGTRQQLWKP